MNSYEFRKIKKVVWIEQMDMWNFWIEYLSELIRFIPIHSEICIRTNRNSPETIRKKFRFR